MRATLTPGLGHEALPGTSFLRYCPFPREGDRLTIGHGQLETSDLL
ncbi:MAG: hypothetical protein HKP03_07300 [Xanthomonadales bacterium]|nr:hypothetical protein [Xanthomonadales bacterium]